MSILLFPSSHLHRLWKSTFLQCRMRSYLFLIFFKKRNRNSSRNDYLVKVRFRTRIKSQLVNKSCVNLYHTCAKKSIEFVKNRKIMRPNYLQRGNNRLFVSFNQLNSRGYFGNSQLNRSGEGWNIHHRFKELSEIVKFIRC